MVLEDDSDFVTDARHLPDLRERTIHDTPKPAELSRERRCISRLGPERLIPDLPGSRYALGHGH